MTKLNYEQLDYHQRWGDLFDSFNLDQHSINWQRTVNCGLAAVGIRDIMQFASRRPHAIGA